MPVTPSVVIVCGPPGAGKSTYVRGRKGANDLVLDVDDLFRALTWLPDREKPKRLVPFVLAARDGVIDLLKSGFLGPDRVWVIMCGHHDNEWRAELAAALKAKTVILRVPAGECRVRMLDQQRPLAHVDEMTRVAEDWGRRFCVMPGEAAEYVQAGREIGADGWPVS